MMSNVVCRLSLLAAIMGGLLSSAAADEPLSRVGGEAVAVADAARAAA
jgi:hypothetical protein